MRKVAILVLTILTMLFVVSCTNEVKETSPYAAYPFTGKSQPVMTKVSTDKQEFKGIFHFSIGNFNDYWIVSLKDGGTARAANVSAGGSKNIVDGTWSFTDGKFSLSVKDMIPEKNVQGKIESSSIDWNSWTSNAKIKINGYTLPPELEKLYDDSTLSLSVDKSDLVGLWIHTDDYGKAEGFRFLADGNVWEYRTNGSSFNCNWAKSSSENEITLSYKADGLTADIYNFVIIGDDLYLTKTGSGFLGEPTRYTRVEE